MRTEAASQVTNLQGPQASVARGPRQERVDVRESVGVAERPRVSISEEGARRSAESASGGVDAPGAGRQSPEVRAYREIEAMASRDDVAVDRRLERQRSANVSERSQETKAAVS